MVNSCLARLIYKRNVLGALGLVRYVLLSERRWYLAAQSLRCHSARGEGDDEQRSFDLLMNEQSVMTFGDWGR